MIGKIFGDQCPKFTWIFEYQEALYGPHKKDKSFCFFANFSHNRLQKNFTNRRFTVCIVLNPLIIPSINQFQLLEHTKLTRQRLGSATDFELSYAVSCIKTLGDFPQQCRSFLLPGGST